ASSISPAPRWITRRACRAPASWWSTPTPRPPAAAGRRSPSDRRARFPSVLVEPQGLPGVANLAAGKAWQVGVYDRFQRRHHRVQRRGAGMPLVVPGNQCPGRVGPVGAVEHVLIGLPVFLGPGAVAQILRCQLPVLAGVVQALGETAQLLFLADVEHQLDDHHAVVVELPLELVDLVVGLLPAILV